MSSGANTQRVHSDMNPSLKHRSLMLFVFVFALSILASSSLLLLDQSNAEANNPPTSVLGTLSFDPDEPITDPTSPVSAMVEANGRYYVAGDFDVVAGETRRSLVAVEVATGQLDPTFAPVISGSNSIVDALAISPDGSSLFVGGRFTQVDGTFSERIAKLDAISGELDSTFTANINAQVQTINTDGTSVWVGGIFSTVNGLPAANLAKLDATTGALDTGWLGTADARVRDIELHNGVLWVGGNFDNIAGTATARLAPLDATTGNLLATWAPDFPEDEVIYAVSVPPDGSAVYVGTRGTATSGGNAIRKYDAANGQALWQKIGAGDTQAIEATNDTVYAGGHGNFVFTIARFNLDGTPNNGVAGEDSDLADTPFPANGYVESDTNLNATRRNKLWSLDAATGDLTSWNPDADSTDGVWELVSGPSGLLVGGDFRNIINPSGAPNNAFPAVFTPHFTVFAGLGNGGNPAPEPFFDIDCLGTQCNFDASASLDNGSITAYAWDFGDGQTTTGLTASANLANDTTHEVTLTVTDDAGISASRSQLVPVGNAGTPITPIDTVSINQTNNQLTVQLPNNAESGDVAIAFVSMNDSSTVATAPTGWVYVDDQINGSLRTYVYTRTLNAAEAGANATFSLSASVKSDLTVSTFRGVDGTNPIAAFDTTATATARAEHIAAALTFAGDATILQFWAERTSASTELFAAPDLATLNTSIGALGGRINTVLALDPNVRTDSSPSSVAVTEHQGRRVLGWSVALNEGVAPVDAAAPVVTLTSPTTLAAGTTDLMGGVTDDISGTAIVQVIVQNNQTGNYWNGTAWTSTWARPTAILNGNDTWSLPNIDLNTPGTYRIRLWGRDNNANSAYTPPQQTLSVE